MRLVEWLRGAGGGIREQMIYRSGDPGRLMPDSSLPFEQRWAMMQGASSLVQTDFVLQEIIRRVIKPVLRAQPDEGKWSRLATPYGRPQQLGIPIKPEELQFSPLSPEVANIFYSLGEEFKDCGARLEAYLVRYLDDSSAPDVFNLSLLTHGMGVQVYGRVITRGWRWGQLKADWVGDHDGRFRRHSLPLTEAVIAARRHLHEIGAFNFAGELIGLADWKVNTKPSPVVA